MQEKFCVECGNKLPLSAAFCNRCGARQPVMFIPPLKNTAPASENTAPPNNVSPESAVETVENSEPVTETAAEKSVPETEAVSSESTVESVENSAAPEAEKLADAVENVAESAGNAENKTAENVSDFGSFPPPQYTPPPTNVYTVDNSAAEQQGMKGGYVAVVTAALLAVSIFVWAIFAINSDAMDIGTKSSSSRSYSSEYSSSESSWDKSSSSLPDPTSEPVETSKNDDEYKGVGGYDSDSSTGKSAKGSYQSKSGSYEEGKYTVGKDIPEGEYFIYVSDGSHYSEDSIPSFYMKVKDDEDIILSGWYQYSMYVKLSKGQSIEVSGADIYDFDAAGSLRNDPFEQPGAFIVGRDVEPGTYEFTSLTDQDYESYELFESLDDLMENEGFRSHVYLSDDDDGKIELKEGQILILEWCTL